MAMWLCGYTAMWLHGYLGYVAIYGSCMFTLGSVITQVLVGSSKQLQQIIQIEHNNVKNSNCPEAI